ncbi:MAG: T9SS type A sorting domain-containing protein [Ignavibacteriae bacterium]|nr:T9SS type A sorting domain-containing protein [Ignavibacteriota bacterium]
MKKLTFLIILFTGIINFAFSQVIPIDSVRRLDANGVPIMVGQHVLVKGVVTTHQELGAPLVYFQVNSAGLVAYDAAFGNGVTRGDSVIVGGLVTHYNGLIELQPVDSFRVLAQNVTTPVPNKITPTQGRNGEQWEGKLIRIDSITMVKTTGGVQATSWSTTASGTNYWIFSGSDSCQIRIYTSTNIAGTTIPPYPFSIVALMSQFTSSPPYNTGYQIIPRDLSDIIISSGGPTIPSAPVESNITQTGITLSFNTIAAGDTKVKYFVSDSIGQPVVYTDSVYNAALVTSHSINLANLLPGKIYYALVSSTNANGTSTKVKYFSTASRNGSTGRFETYFNFAVDTTVALPNNKASGGVDFKTRLIQRIDSAQYSIDMAIYSFDDITLVKTALINAMVRGVRVRVIYDSRNVQPLMQELINAGIRVQQRPVDSYIMHNKFFVFDGRDTSITSVPRKWLWGGSANITTAQFYSDAQNVILIQDESLCNSYTREFEEMWGSHNNVNNSTNAKFGNQKTDNTPHIFNINGKRVECYFSPSDDVQGKIVTMLDQTHKSINFCILDFTSTTIANKMKTKYSYPTKMVRGVFDRGQYNSGDSLRYNEMKGISSNPTYNWNPPARVFLDNYGGQMHDKYIIVDADSLSSSPLVETGSYNFTTNANTGNDENILIIYDSLVANKYYQDFVKRLTDAGGTIDVRKIDNEVPVTYSLEQNYPNPFNPSTTIKFRISKPELVIIRIYDLLGREVATLLNRKLEAGSYELPFNIQNTGTALSSGLYFYKMQAGSFSDTKKMVLVK